MPSIEAHRGRLIALAVVFILASFAAIAALDIPGGGIAYFSFLPIALVAMTSGPRWGAVCALATGALYSVVDAGGLSLGEGDESLSTAVVRVFVSAAVAVLIGKYAQDQLGATSRMTELANHDPLTGLLNARAHAQRLGHRCARGEPFVLVVCDMDNLKLLNDELGHSAGNEALQRLANALAGAVRAGDDVARIGGDEFAILAPSAGAEAEAVLVRRLETAVGDAGVSATFGTARFPEDASDAASLFERADARLYERKRARSGASRPPAAGQRATMSA